MAGFSAGYSPTCEGTPAEGSPYMWPMAWSAHIQSESMAFGSDEIIYTSRSNVYYRLDKNWKRSDTYYQRGVQRSIGQSPCDPENVVTSDNPEESFLLACRRDSDEYRTMIHRGGKMMFITWKNGTQVGSSDPNQIEECNWLDLAVVGNIRPDWYMDDRGDSTDVQYMGDQHVYHMGKPRLVKQWRKQDFANQYFTMSVLGNPNNATDGIHWPMILNVPGEGFGDDFLQIYSNHSLLTDDDDYKFLLDEALEGIGGVCEQMNQDGEGVGPPTGQTVHIPSNLEVDPNAWYSNVYTYSPVWEPPAKDDSDQVSMVEDGRATTEATHAKVLSCYDPTTQSVDLSVEFLNVDAGAGLPWMALGYRETEECLMIPRSGNDTQIILVATQSDDETLAPHLTMLPREARGMSEAAITSIYDNQIPLSNVDGYSSVMLQVPSSETAVEKTGVAETSVVLKFQQSFPGGAPEVMHLMYAIGSSPQVGFHANRECMDITEFPICTGAAGVATGNTTTMERSDSSESQALKEETTASSSSRTTSVVLAGGMVAVVSTIMAMM